MSAGAAERCCEIVPRWDTGSRRSRTVAVLATLQNGSSERRLTVLGVAGQKRIDGEGSSAFAEDGHFGWITAKRVDVALYPVESKSLIEETQILSSHR